MSNRGLHVLALGAMLGISAIGLTQCRMIMVDDKVSDVQISAESVHHKSKCFRICQREWRQAKGEEQRRFHKALHACGDDWACRRAERETHEDKVEALAKQRKECKRNCYNEGDGDGGHD